MPTNLQEAIERAATSPGNRVSISGESPTWGGLKPATLLPDVVTQVNADRLSFTSVNVSKSANATLVTPGGTKPVVATIATAPHTIGKFSGMASLQLESFLESTDVVAAVLGTLFAAANTAADAQANADLAAAIPAATPAADWVSAIAGGQSAVVANGGAPQLVVLPAAAWPALAAELAGSAGLTTSSGDAIVSVLGSRVLLSPQGTTAFVLSPDALCTVRRDVGFLTVPEAATNTWQVVADLVQATYVANSALAAAIAVTTTP